MGGQRSLIAATCEDPATLVRWYDYLYSQEGSFLCNYGVEGEAYTLVDGEIVLSEDNLLAREDGLLYSEVQNYYQMPAYFAYYYDWQRGRIIQPESSLKASEIWFDSLDTPFDNTVSAYLSLTAEEASEISSKYTDIQTWVQEYTAKVIVGEASLDEWDAYVAKVGEMGLADVLATYQAAFERYQAR